MDEITPAPAPPMAPGASVPPTSTISSVRPASPVVPPPIRRQTSPAHPLTERPDSGRVERNGRSKLATFVGAVAIAVGAAVVAAFMTGQFNAPDPFLVPDPDAAAAPPTVRND